MKKIIYLPLILCMPAMNSSGFCLSKMEYFSSRDLVDIAATMQIYHHAETLPAWVKNRSDLESVHEGCCNNDPSLTKETNNIIYLFSGFANYSVIINYSQIEGGINVRFESVSIMDKCGNVKESYPMTSRDEVNSVIGESQ